MMDESGQGIIMYGPPASGKDTITGELCRLDLRFVPFARIKLGTGRTTGYRMASAETVSDLQSREDIIWENRRYGSVYIVDRPELTRQLARNIPVLHLGQTEAIDAVLSTFPHTRWHVVYLWCPRAVAEDRIIARQTGDTAARLAAWDETPALNNSSLVIDTSRTPIMESAQRILSLVFGTGPQALSASG